MRILAGEGLHARDAISVNVVKPTVEQLTYQRLEALLTSINAGNGVPTRFIGDRRARMIRDANNLRQTVASYRISQTPLDCLRVCMDERSALDFKAAMTLPDEPAQNVRLTDDDAYIRLRTPLARVPGVFFEEVQIDRTKTWGYKDKRYRAEYYLVGA